MEYKKGSKGDVVKQIQTALHLTPDGIFGPLTEQAVKDFQRKNALVVDGIVGEKTLSLLLPKPQEEVFITKGYINTHITRLTNRPIKYIAIHYTAGSTSRKGTAMTTRNVFLKRKASADFVVDDETIVQINPDLRNYYCWSVDDPLNKTTGGGRLYGKANNRNTISIEICSNLKKGGNAAYPNHDGWYFTDAALDNARRLVRFLMAKYNVPKSNVVRHYDISGKMCPGIIGWNEAPTYTDEGKLTGKKNSNKEWLEFWNSI